MIRYIKHTLIDKTKWDDCIDNAINPLIYAKSWYLDIVSPRWEALIEDDYHTVMPLPAKQKYGLPYLIQPKFTQQLGIFSKSEINTEITARFLSSVPRKFFWQDFNFNYANPITDFVGSSILQKCKISERYNYELDLRKNYDSILANYHTNTARNIRKAQKSNIGIVDCFKTDEFLNLFALRCKVKQEVAGLQQLRAIIGQALLRHEGELKMAYNKYGDIIAGAFYLITLNRVIYLGSFNTNEGQENSAMFLIMDGMIRKYASQSKIFDFEGSMVPGIARFFSGFGATPSTYLRYRKTLW